MEQMSSFCQMSMPPLVFSKAKQVKPIMPILCCYWNISLSFLMIYCCDFIRWMVMSYDTCHMIIHHLASMHATIDAWSCHMTHHIPSMHGHVIWYITYHRCMVMSHDTSSTIDAWSFHDTSPIINAWWFHVIWYITYHRCIIMSCDTSSAIDALSYHMIHHLLSMHGHVIWYITYYRCMVMLYDTSSMGGDVSYNMTMYRW